VTEPQPPDLADPELRRAIGDQLIRHHNELRRQLNDLLTGRTTGLHRELLSHCLTFCADLRMHHTREDGAFAAFETQLPGLAPVLDKLRAEHRVVAQTLAGLEKLGDGPELRTELEQLAPVLEAHFTYEEEQLLPVLAPPPR
jgi:hypothetical protein